MSDLRFHPPKDDPRYEGRYGGIVTPLIRPDRWLRINGVLIEEWCDEDGSTICVLINGQEVPLTYMEAVREVNQYFSKKKPVLAREF